MSTDSVRECADDLDDQGFDPSVWLLIAKDTAGRVLMISPAGQGQSIELLAEAQEMAREASGAPGMTQ